jgi:hypothetical protein
MDLDYSRSGKTWVFSLVGRKLVLELGYHSSFRRYKILPFFNLTFFRNLGPDWNSAKSIDPDLDSMNLVEFTEKNVCVITGWWPAAMARCAWSSPRPSVEKSWF